MFGALGLVGWILAVAALSRVMRARSTGMMELGLTAFALLFSVPLVGAALLYFVNSGLDPTAPVTHTTTVLSVRRSRDDNNVRVVPWDPARTWQKVGMDYATFKTLHQGDTIEVDVHPGTLGWPWVSAVRRVP
jgi:hypothetical protein